MKQFKAPPNGIPAGATVECRVIEAEQFTGETIQVTNPSDMVACNMGNRRGWADENGILGDGPDQDTEEFETVVMSAESELADMSSDDMLTEPEKNDGN